MLFFFLDIAGLMVLKESGHRGKQIAKFNLETEAYVS